MSPTFSSPIVDHPVGVGIGVLTFSRFPPPGAPKMAMCWFHVCTTAGVPAVVWPTSQGSDSERSFDTDDWNALVAGTTFAAKLKFTHSQMATGSYPHQLWVEMPACQYVSGKQDAVKNERRTEAEFAWEARYDTVTSDWCTVTLVNATAAYASYS